MEQASQVGGILGIVVTVVGVVYSAINHKRLRSTCCGRKIDIAIDIDSTSPQVRHRDKGDSLESSIVKIKPLTTPDNGTSTERDRDRPDSNNAAGTQASQGEKT